MANLTFTPNFTSLANMKSGKLWLCLLGRCTEPPTGQPYWELHEDEYVEFDLNLQPWTSAIYGTLDLANLVEGWLFNLTSPDAATGEPALGFLDLEIIEGSQSKSLLSRRHCVSLAAHREDDPPYGEIVWYGSRILMDLNPDDSTASFRLPRAWKARISYHPFCYHQILPRLRMESIELYLELFQE